MCHLGGPNDDDVQMDIIFDDLEETLKEYPIGGYVIAYEQEPYKHFHFLVEMEERDYAAYRKRVFIDKWGLRGQARDGKPREYGKVKNIEDFDKMLSYTIKDENFRTNLDQEQIDNALDKSFKKEKPKLLKEKMVKFIDNKCQGTFTDQHDARFLRKKKVLLYIVEFCQNNKIPLTKSVLNSYYLFYRQFTTTLKNKYEAEQILRELIGDYEFNELN